MAPLLNIVVVGGSLGGLFNGIALSRRGHRVTILERNPTPLMHDQGAGIVAGTDVQKFFDRYDRTHSSLAVTSHARQYLNRTGEVIHREKRAQQMTCWDLLYHLLRANFDGIETSYTHSPPRHSTDGPVEYRYGRKVTSIADLGANNGVRITSEDTTTTTTENQFTNSETTTADILIAADGASSTTRTLLHPSSPPRRTYAGYIAWRGTCPEHLLSPSTRTALAESFTFHHAPGTQILGYLIPGPSGTLAPGRRLLNWVWYVNYAEASDELRDIMTDADGKTHHLTLPPGGAREEVWAGVKERARRELPPAFAEAVERTEAPFVQAVTDVLAERAGWWGGKVVLTGDALAGFRPHTAASTSQAAFDAEQTAALVDGEIGLEEWEKRVMKYAREVQKKGVELGDRSQFGEHPLNG
ncbi:monooxygenase [Macrophomina phaseolina]|uniref:Monooxygenase n=1 Tax=Macrophomina phaseolina TaxID=35725 RepID=A0ABQ8G072_9PEZI|nr:monooxygenase [Macrophomina phaseolina]